MGIGDDGAVVQVHGHDEAFRVEVGKCGQMWGRYGQVWPGGSPGYETRAAREGASGGAGRQGVEPER